MAASIASWFSTLEALAAIKTIVSASTPLAKIYENTSKQKIGTTRIQNLEIKTEVTIPDKKQKEKDKPQ